MTAALPDPQDDRRVESAVGTAIPPIPEVPADVAAAELAAPPESREEPTRSPQKSTKKPRKPRSSAGSPRPRKPAPSPQAPPLPPLPPVPAAVAAAAAELETPEPATRVMPTAVEPDTQVIDVEPAVDEPIDATVEAPSAAADAADADDAARHEDLADARAAAVEDAAAETVAIEWPVADPPEAVLAAEEPPTAVPAAEPATEDIELDPSDVFPDAVDDERDLRPDDDDTTLAAVLAVVEPDPEPESASGQDSSADASEAAASESALRLTGLTKVYGDTRAVDAIDLDIPAGAFYGLVGPNGAGKTTTLSMIAGLLRPDAGSIRVAGIDLARDPARAKRQMGILPDRLRTFDRLTGRQLLYYYGVLRGLKPAVVENRIGDLARAFDLADALGRSVSDYSAGMTKKVMLAGAMIHSPRLLVLDEPFEAVDPVSSAVILDILQAYVAHGGTVVLSSHGMDLVQRACSGVAVLVGGRVLAAGTVDEVRDGRSLEQRFLELAGGTSAAEGLEWLHTFSD